MAKRRERRVVKDERQTRKRSESLAAHAGRQSDAGQINRRDADGTDGVEADFRAHFLSGGLQNIKVVENASGGFAMYRPDPLGRLGANRQAKRFRVERRSPFSFEHAIRQSKSSCMIDEPFAEGSIAEHEPRRFP